MVLLKELHVSNYRSLVNTTVKFETNLTALVGTNGAGKTNILKSVLLLKGLIRGDRLHRRFRRGQNEDSNSPHSGLRVVFDVNGVGVEINAEIYFNVSNSDESVEYAKTSVRILKKGSRLTKLPPGALSFIDTFADRPSHPTFSHGYLTSSDEINELLFKIVPAITKLKYYSATRFSNPTSCPASIELEGNELKPSYYGSSGHETFLYDIYRSHKTDSQAFARYKNIVTHLGLGLVDNIDFAEYKIPNTSIKVLPGGKVEKIDKNRILVIPSFTVDGLKLPPNQLSEGTFKTLALVFYVMNADGKLLLIEEPEVCVHHGLLGGVIELIKQQSRDKQFIITTHSDYVMDKLSPDNVILVRKHPEGTHASTLKESLPKIDYDAMRAYLNESGNLGDYWKESGYLSE